VKGERQVSEELGEKSQKKSKGKVPRGFGLRDETKRVDEGGNRRLGFVR